MKKSSVPFPLHRNDFLDWLNVERGISSNSQENYDRFILKFFRWLNTQKLLALKPHELTTEHIFAYRIFLSQMGGQHELKKSTQNSYLIALRNLLHYFADRDIVSLPAEKIKLPKNKDEGQVKFMTLEQLEKVFAAPDIDTPIGVRDRALLETLFSTGMRLAELIALDRSRLDGSRGKPDFEISIVGKGRRVRTVYFSGRALDWLHKYLAQRIDQDPALFVRLIPGGPDSGSLRMGPRGIKFLVAKYVKKSGIPILATVHTFRHSFATDLMNKGVGIRIIQEMLGHSDIRTTQRYLHNTAKHLRDIHRQFHGIGTGK